MRGMCGQGPRARTSERRTAQRAAAAGLEVTALRRQLAAAQAKSAKPKQSASTHRRLAFEGVTIGVGGLGNSQGDASQRGQRAARPLRAVKIKALDGDDFDIESNQHHNFIVATFDEFAVFMRALGATKPDTPHPNPVEQFLSTHPTAKEFLGSRTYPDSFAQATYWGINSLKFTNAKGQSVFVRYRFIPRAGEKYLTPDERKAKSASYLQDEIVQRIAKGPVVFDLVVQIAEKGDKVEDPSIAWPDSRKTVKLGTFSLTKITDDQQAVQKTLLFLPGQPHPGVEPADPMLVLRNTAYPISLGERQ